MSAQDKLDVRHLLETTSDSFDHLPILARMQFVRNLLLNNGGEKDSTPQDPVMVIAAEVVKGVIEILESHPRAAKLRGPALD